MGARKRKPDPMVIDTEDPLFEAAAMLTREQKLQMARNEMAERDAQRAKQKAADSTNPPDPGRTP